MLQLFECMTKMLENVPEQCLLEVSQCIDDLQASRQLLIADDALMAVDEVANARIDCKKSGSTKVHLIRFNDTRSYQRTLIVFE